MLPMTKRANQFKALGHPARLEILRCILQGPEAGTPVGEILQRLAIPASTLSHHLATLATAGLVTVLRRGTSLLYRADFQTLHGLTAPLWEDCRAGSPQDSRDGRSAAAVALAPEPQPPPDTLDVEED